MMVRQAKRRGFTLLMPTAPADPAGYFWPGGSMKGEDAPVIDGIANAKAALEAKTGKFNETFVIGFSSGAYYASTLALRGSLDVDGYIVLAGGTSWLRPDDAHGLKKRAPVFVGISAADPTTADHSRSLATTLATLGWPYRAQEKDVGHNVDEGFLVRGLAYLRARVASTKLARSITASYLSSMDMPLRAE
jgi:hypothetical protein